jgi:hypothetical protein
LLLASAAGETERYQTAKGQDEFATQLSLHHSNVPLLQLRLGSGLLQLDSRLFCPASRLGSHIAPRTADPLGVRRFPI